MQRARKPTSKPDVDDIALLKASPVRMAGDGDVQQAASPARELLATLHAAHGATAEARPPEPVVATWDGWMKVAVVIGGSALAWAAVVGVGWLLIDL